MGKRKITEINLYALLEITSAATEQEIKKAYRKKALKVHPDKNPDDPKAAEQFLELSDALAILTDPKAREAYDKTLKAKQLAKERLDVLDHKRRKLREDLERREQAAKDAAKGSRTSYTTEISDEQRLQREIERLRKEGSRILNEEQETVREKVRQIHKEQLQKQQPSIKSEPAKSANAQSFADFESMILQQLAQKAQEQKKAKEQQEEVKCPEVCTSSGDN